MQVNRNYKRKKRRRKKKENLEIFSIIRSNLKYALLETQQLSIIPFFLTIRAGPKSREKNSRVRNFQGRNK